MFTVETVRAPSTPSGRSRWPAQRSSQSGSERAASSLQGRLRILITRRLSDSRSCRFPTFRNYYCVEGGRSGLAWNTVAIEPAVALGRAVTLSRSGGLYFAVNFQSAGVLWHSQVAQRLEVRGRQLGELGSQTECESRQSNGHCTSVATDWPRPRRIRARHEAEQITTSLLADLTDRLTVSAECGGRWVRPGGQHCGQRLGKGPVRPPGPAASQDAHQMRQQTPRDLPKF